MQTTYVFGHRNPDTDSVCSAISLSYLRNQLKEKCEPRVLGHLNRETKFVLDYFKIKEPAYLNDVRIQIRNINYHKKAMVHENTSLGETYEYIAKKGVTGVPIVDSSKKLKGLITLKEISKELISGDIKKLYTSFENILKVLNGTTILKFDEEIKGDILSASFYSGTFTNQIKLSREHILISGDRYKILSYAIESKVGTIILVGSLDLPEELLKVAKKNKVNVISTPFNSYETSNKMKLCQYVKNLNINTNPLTFEQFDYRDDFIEASNKHGHTNYPVVNKKGDCLGLIRATQANDYEKKKVILVDHNQASQSVPGIEEAIIDGIVDHHNIGTIGTTMPINFRVMPVGCTCTVIYQLFIESKITIPQEIAGIMLSAIISDTLLFKSPTTTEMDIEVGKKLARLCHINIEKFGLEMFKAGSSIKGLKPEEVLYQDFKSYKVGDDNLGIAQIMTMDIDDVKKDLNRYIELLDTIALTEYRVVALFITDIIENGSYVIFNTKSKEIISDAFGIEDINEGTYIPHLVSRKKQMLPDLMEAMEKSSI